MCFKPNPNESLPSSQQYGYPQPPQPYYPIQPSGIPLQILIQQMQESRALAVENVQLHNRLVQKDLAETANTEIFKSWDKKIFTYGRNGIPRLLLNHIITHAKHIIPQPPSRQEPFFFIALDAVDTPLIISEADFFQDSRLILALQELPGVEITLRRTQKQTAMLLRQAIGNELTTVYLPSYAGWTHSKDGAFQFYAFPGFNSHRKKEQFEIPAPIQVISNPEAVVAAQQFWPIFSVIRNLFARHLLILWYHVSALSSLLDHLGYHVFLALNCFVPGTDQQRYLKQLFGWFGDAPLSLDLRPADFVDGLLARCNQPLVIEDSSRLGHAKANVQILEEVLSTGTVSWDSGKEVLSLPIHAPVTLISSGASDLTCSPFVCDLDLSPKFFDRDHWLSLDSLTFDNQEYLSAFLSYTANHVADLQSALDLGIREAISKSQDKLSEKCTNMLGIFIAISTFLADFFTFCSPAIPPIEDPLHEVLLQELLNRLKQTSEKAYQTDLADIFITVARQQIQQGLLGIDYQKSCELSRKDLVIPTETALNFTPEAFRCVCNSLSCSTPAVLNALADSGLFCGRQTNPWTAQTRISVWDELGVRHSIAVYSIDRSAFEQLGDPLIFDWEV